MEVAVVFGCKDNGGGVVIGSELSEAEASSSRRWLWQVLGFGGVQAYSESIEELQVVMRTNGRG